MAPGRGYYHPILLFGFFLEDEGNDVDWDRIYECIETLNGCVRSKETNPTEPLKPPDEV